MTKCFLVHICDKNAKNIIGLRVQVKKGIEKLDIIQNKDLSGIHFNIFTGLGKST
jgi:hypothetical protein